ncbi:MAG: hypothetical protein ACRDPZ_13950 [Gaiellaceae bacterium]
MNRLTEDTLRGIVVGGMSAVGAGSLFVAFVGGLIQGESPSGETGRVLIGAGFVGLITAAVIAHGVARGTITRVVVAVVLQTLVAVLVLVWWLASDFWSGTAHAGLSTIVLGAVIALDALTLFWALRNVREQRRSAPDLS